MCDVKNVSITSLNILDGMYHKTNWDILQPAWENEGMGFVEFCAWITDIAIVLNDELTKRNPEDFPGVFDYEVSYVLGCDISQHITIYGELPSIELIKEWNTKLTDDFFARG